MSRRELPKLESLGDDLLRTNPWQRWQPFAMPWIYAIGFILSWDKGWYPACAACLVLVFSACSTSTHDILHGSLGLTRRQTEWTLSLMGGAVLESGHAYRITHLRHHAAFPDHDDPESAAAHYPLWKVILTGPAFLPTLWWSAYKTRKAERPWLIVEALLAPIALAIGIALRHSMPGILAYAVAVIVSSWLYPVFAVWLPHREMLETPIFSRTYRGLILPKLFLPLAYHLEHHLYPKVPSHNLPLLAKRLTPHLTEYGVQAIHVL